MAKVLVTGGAGYVGSVLVELLLNDGHEVTVVDRFFFGPTLDHLYSNGSSGHTAKLHVVKDDVRRLTAEVFRGIDAVIDLAALCLDPSDSWLTKATWEINHKGRVRTANLAKANGVKRYLLGASCSVYGWQPEDVVCSEDDPPAPISVYSKAILQAENDTLALADGSFCVTAIRQSTVFGLSPRMRFDVAVNRMTLKAFETGNIPLMRNGNQWRPWVHVQDTAGAMVLVLDSDESLVNHEIFNVGSERCQVTVKTLAETVARLAPRKTDIKFYGDPDIRSYRTAFTKLEALGFEARRSLEDGIAEIFLALADKSLVFSEKMVNLDWYTHLENLSESQKTHEMYGGIIKI